MRERIVEAEFIEELIVACPRCGRRNRLHNSAAAGVYKCGACHAALANPFAVRKLSARRVGIVAGLVVVAFGAIAFISKSSAPRHTYSVSPPSPVSSAAPTVPVAAEPTLVLARQSPSAVDEQLRKKVWAERDARLDKLISDAWSPSPSAPQSAVNDPEVRATPPPQLEAPTEIPRNGILFDAFPDRTGEGKFTVINGSARHAVAKVIDIRTARKILSFGINAGGRTVITAIPDGTYNVIFAFGDYVYVGTDRFEKPRGFSKFDRPFTFATRITATETEEGTLYRTSATSLEVTLTAVIGGNITTSSISQQEFERY